jgi:GWxTD domain-containing protein
MYTIIAYLSKLFKYPVRRKGLHRSIPGFLCAVAVSCYAPPDRGQQYQPTGEAFYQPGLPHFQMEVLEHCDQAGVRGISLLIVVPRTTLVFVRSEEGYRAGFDVDVEVLDEDLESTKRTIGWHRDVFLSGFGDTRTQETIVIDTTLPSPAGVHTIRVSLRDSNTGKTAQRAQVLSVGESDSTMPWMSDIRLYGRDESGRRRPLSGAQLALPAESLTCSVLVRQIPPGHPGSATCRIVRYPGDSTVANRPYAFTALQGSVDAEGVLDDPAEVAEVPMQITDDSGDGRTLSARMHFSEPGIYALTVSDSITDQSGRRISFAERRRTVVMMHPGFPRPSTLTDLLFPLSYISEGEEFDSLIAGGTPATRRQRFDRFWLKLARDAQAAANLLRAYYTRVEEANTFFSGVKEGWRTDRGMVYIVLGPPRAVATGLNIEIWYYGNSEQDVVNTYVFRRIDLPSAGWPFDHYILERKAYYDQPWLEAVDRWRRGAAF